MNFFSLDWDFFHILWLFFWLVCHFLWLVCDFFWLFSKVCNFFSLVDHFFWLSFTSLCLFYTSFSLFFAAPLYSPVKCSWLQTFLSVDLNGLVQIEQLVALVYSLHWSWVSRFIGKLLAKCCLQMVAAAQSCSKNFSATSSPIFTWGGSKYYSSLHFMWMQLPHSTWCWYWVMRDFDGNGSHESCLGKTLLKSA